MIRHLLFNAFLLLIVTSSSWAQDSDKAKILALFETAKSKSDSLANFQMETKYTLYEDYKSSNIVEQYSGIYIKKGKDSYSKIHHTEFVVLKKTSIKVDHDDHIMQVKNGVSEKESFDLSTIGKNFKTFQLSSNGDFWVCTLTAPEITFMSYGKVVVFIDKKSKRLSKQVLYLLEENPGSKAKTKKTFPRLEISFSNLKRLEKSGRKEFKTDYYYSLKNGQYEPSEHYKGFQIIK